MPDQPVMPRHVLLVEEDRRTAARLAQMLTEDGFEVEVAHDGEAALERLRVRPPAALVTNLYLPRVDGLTLARHVYVSSPGTVVLLVTEHTELLDTEILPARPGLLVFGKPLDVDVLAGVLHEVLQAPIAT